MDQMYDQLAPYYDLLHKELVADIPFILDLAQQVGGPILELGIGTGRLMVPLVEAGFSVVGVDNNEQMLRQAEERLRPLRGWRLIQGDMNDVALAETFALIVIPYNTLMHLNEKQVKVMLRRAKGWMGENGRLLIDLSNPFWLAALEDDSEPYLDRELELAEGSVLRQWAENHVDQERQEVRTDWRYELISADGGEEPIHVSMIYHYYFPHQFALWLKEAGLQMIHLWGGYEKELFDEEAERMVVWIGKRS